MGEAPGFWGRERDLESIAGDIQGNYSQVGCFLYLWTGFWLEFGAVSFDYDEFGKTRF